MTPIADMEVYTTGMQKGMEDKLWFLEKMPKDIKLIYDFGCADGALLQEVNHLKPNINLFGYDPSREMVKMANHRHLGDRVDFWSVPAAYVPPKTLLNCSSVFHEVHSYGTPKSIAEDYKNIFEVGAEYIAIRDMFYCEEDSFTLEDVMKIYEKSDWHLTDFIAHWGALVKSREDTPMNLNQKEILHYLLKYRYTVNWEREVKENYLPFTLKAFLAKIPDNYEIVYLESYTLPFLKEQIKKDFDIDLKAKTHAKILLKKKNI